jgi:signal transduction histidine kinase/ligand-binding sensor domain-containing protein
MNGCFNGILLGVFLFTSTTQAQELNVRSFSFKEGLNTYNIYRTLQDSHGFVWIATQDGMYRYNGKTFDVIKGNTNGDSVAIGNAFLDAAIGADRQLYLADYNYGVNIIGTTRLDISTVNAFARKPGGKPEPYYGIEKIFPDNNKNIWAGGAGFLLLKKHNEENFVVLNRELDLPETFTVSFLKAVSATHLAAGITGEGMLLFNMQTGKCDARIRKLSGETSVDNIIDISVNGDTVYAITSAQIVTGVLRGTQWQFLHAADHPVLRQTVASCIVHDKYNRIWVGSNQGITVYDKTTAGFSFIRADIFNERALKDNNINHLFIDNQDNLWISTSKLLHIASLAEPFLKPYSASPSGQDRMDHIYTLAAKNDRELYATAKDGLFEIDLSSKNIRRIKGSLSFGAIHHLEKIEPDFWIVSTNNGMAGFVPSTDLLSKELLIKKYPEWTAYAANYFNTAYRSGNNYYWASEENEGLVKWDKDARLIRKLKSGTAGIPENHIRNMKTDRAGRLWLLSDNTASCFDTQKDTVIQVLRYTDGRNGFIGNLFSDMYDDGRQLWFCTYGGGINGYNKTSGQWTYITERDGLCNNCVYSILPENDSIFWVSTNMGLSRVNSYTGTCSNYYAEDGLQDNSFDEKGSLAIGNKLYFGGINGFTELNTGRYRNALSDFPAYIYRVEYFNGGKKQVLNDLNWSTIRLPPGTNPIIIHLAALSFSGAQKIKFSYSIEGMHDYIDVQDANTITLNTLSYGDYTVNIRYTREDGSLAEKALSLSLYIAPKWFQTWWFMALAAISVAGAAYAFYRMRLNQVKKEQQMRMKLARDLHDDLGSTINSVKVYANLAQMHKEDQYLKKVIDITREAIIGLRDMIWVLDDGMGNIDHLVSRLNIFASPLCEAQGINYVLNIDYEARTHKLNQEEKKNLYMIMKEAINNAVKYSEGKQIEVNISVKKGKPVIQVKDNGKGFVAGVVKEGNGMKNLRQRAQQIKYQLEVQAGEGNGTTVQVQKL